MTPALTESLEDTLMDTLFEDFGDDSDAMDDSSVLNALQILSPGTPNPMTSSSTASSRGAAKLVGNASELQKGVAEQEAQMEIKLAGCAKFTKDEYKNRKRELERMRRAVKSPGCPPEAFA
eukprot:14151338-Alexandrium_andersonii.AAC.1